MTAPASFARGKRHVGCWIEKASVTDAQVSAKQSSVTTGKQEVTSAGSVGNRRVGVWIEKASVTDAEVCNKQPSVTTDKQAFRQHSSVDSTNTTAMAPEERVAASVENSCIKAHSPRILDETVSDLPHEHNDSGSIAPPHRELVDPTVSELQQSHDEIWPWNGSIAYVEYRKPQLWGDETLRGPDGALYDIFYPPDCIPEHLSDAASTTATGEETNSEFDVSPPARRDSSSRASSSTSTTRSCTSSLSEKGRNGWVSAEVGVEAMVSFMSLSAVSRFPARSELFERVRLASAVALGPLFHRFALVGSTAMCIDTPESDLDAVVFTKASVNESGFEMPSILPAQALRCIADHLSHWKCVKVQLVDCTRVPVLTVLTADETQSLDLTVDQALGEYHVEWFRSQHVGRAQLFNPLQGMPMPSPDGWSQGLEAAALRCVKWWLRRRRIPVPKEGGYPSIVWTLMVLHALRCSVFVDDAEDSASRGRRLLGAIAAFFDRFAEGGLAGTLHFAGYAGAEFSPEDSHGQGIFQAANLSVLDPTTTNHDSTAAGVQPSDLVPKTSAATHLLYSYELRRAQQLSATALAAAEAGPDCGGIGGGGAELAELFGDLGEPLNTLDVSVPNSHTGIIALRGTNLILGLLQRITPKAGWQAPFLHRLDTSSTFAIRRVHIDEAGTVVKISSPHVTEWFYPSEFVCMVPFSSNGEDAGGALRLEAEGLQRWSDMKALLPKPASTRCGARRSRKQQHQSKRVTS